MSMRKIKKDDMVVVLTGRDKGQRGKVLRVVNDGQKAIIEGVNVVSKTVRPNPQAGVEGGIVKKESSIHISNVALINPKTDKADRVGIKVLEDGRKVRYFKSNNEMVDV